MVGRRQMRQKNRHATYSGRVEDFLLITRYLRQKREIEKEGDDAPSVATGQSSSPFYCNFTTPFFCGQLLPPRSKRRYNSVTSGASWSLLLTLLSPPYPHTPTLPPPALNVSHCSERPGKRTNERRATTINGPIISPSVRSSRSRSR